MTVWILRAGTFCSLEELWRMTSNPPQPLCLPEQLVLKYRISYLPGPGRGALFRQRAGFRPVRGLLSGLLTDGCGRCNPPRRRIQLRWHVLRTQFERFQYIGWNCGARTVHHRSDGSHPRSSIRRPPPQADSRQVRCAGACGAGVARQSRTGHEACPTGSATSASPA